MEKDELEATIKEIFAAGGRPALRKALQKQPLQFLRLMASIAPEPNAAPAKPAAPTANRELTEAELDERGRLLLRALGRDRIARLMNEPEGGND